MNSFERLLISLSAYRNNITGIGDRYKQESQRNEKFKGAEIYSSMQADTKNLFQKEFIETRAKEQKEIDSIFDNINDSVTRWVNKPVRDTGLLTTISAARDTGLHFTLSELEYLNQSLGNTYWGSRIVTQLAKESGVNSVEFEKYNDLDTITRSIKNAKISTDNFLTWYCGDSCEAFNLLSDKELNNQFATALSAGATDSEIFKPDSPILAAALVFDQDDLPVSTYHRTLSDGDKNIIGYMFSGCETRESKQERAASLTKQNPDLVEIFSLDSEIKSILPPEK